MGLSGHVCAFEQDITHLANTLPRAATDSTVIRVLQETRTEIGDNKEKTTKSFRVRRKSVLAALRFLKTFNRDYVNITIDESRLNWIEGEEADLECFTFSTPTLNTNKDDNFQNSDMGCAPKQCLDPRIEADDIQCFGLVDEGGKAKLSESDTQINNELQKCVGQSPNKKEMTMDWPAIDDAPVSEYSDARIFTGAFPWLFPGGIGDIKDYSHPDKALQEWGKRLLYYEDGRFAKDKLFCFFAMNYIIRHRNSTSGKFFIDNFQRNVPDTLEELKEAIKNGNSSFVNHLTYWNKRIKGSSPYWFQKRSELYAWINQHLELGNGAPMFFITLSCAEYFWPDVVQLLRDRLSAANLDTSDVYIGSPALPQLVNDYTIVIQEYFQKRTETWLNTVGKVIFGIKHYWVRYEFAPGRGQIHAHLLAIPDNHDIYELCHVKLKENDGEKKRAKVLADWAETSFGLTASVCDDFDTRCVGATRPDRKDCKCTGDQCEGYPNPVSFRFTDIGDNVIDQVNDGQNLMVYCQMHKCSKFCLRDANKHRYVRAYNLKQLEIIC